MRAVAITAAVLVAIFMTSYATCGPDGPDNPPFTIGCPGRTIPDDAGARTPVSLRSGCWPIDVPLDIRAAPPSSTGQTSVYVAGGIWVELPAGPDLDRCVAVEIENLFADGSRRWVPYATGIQRVATAGGYCVELGTASADSPLALGPTTVRVHVVGATFAGEAEFAANVHR